MTAGSALDGGAYRFAAAIAASWERPPGGPVKGRVAQAQFGVGDGDGDGDGDAVAHPAAPSRTRRTTTNATLVATVRRSKGDQRVEFI
jgi:hypothetical protein